MKTKIEIKNRWTGKILFEFETENNSIKKTVLEALKRGADLSGADLRVADLSDANLRGADLSDADLSGADLSGGKVKSAIVFTGLYRYVVIPYITSENEKRVIMGCHDRSVAEWDADFWNNPNEFPNDGSMKSEMRLMAYKTAKAWLELAEKELLTQKEAA